MTAIPGNNDEFTVNHPTKLSRRLASFDRADKLYILVMSVTALLAFSYLGRLGAFAVLIPTALTLDRMANGRVYYVFGQLCYSLVWIGLVQSDMLWTAEPQGNAIRQFARRSSPLSLDLHIIENPGEEDSDYGILHHKAGKTNSIVIFGDGSDHASVSLGTQFSRQQRVADMVKRVASARGINTGVSYVFRRRPTDVEAVKDWDASNCQHEVLLPEALGKSPEDYTDYDHRMLFLLQGVGECWDMAETQTAQVDMAVVLTVAHEGKLEAAGRGKSLANRREVSRLPIIKLAHTAVAGLEQAKVKNVQIASPQKLEAFLRRSWDVAKVNEFDRQVSDQGDEPVDLTQTVRHWPSSPDSYISVAKDHCVIDGTIHGVVRISGADSYPLPNFFHQMFATDVEWLTISLVGETLDYRGEYRYLTRIIPLKQEARERALGAGDLNPAATEAQKGQEERLEDIYKAKYLQSYLVLVAVSATDMEQFEDDIEEVIRTAESIGLEAQRVQGKVRQVPYLLSATTGVPVKL